MLANPTLDLLKYSSFPAIGEAIRARGDSLLRRWQEVVADKLSAADALTRDQIRDHLPSILKEMAGTLEADDGSHLTNLRQISEGHGELRFHQSFNLDQLLIEYSLLRTVLLDEVMIHLGRQVLPEEVAALNMGVDYVIRRSVMQFMAHQQKQIKSVAEAQSKYLSFLSHDLRGGLNGVLLMAEVLKRELSNEPRFAESVEDIDAMRRSILDTVATMDRFLHAERFRQGKVQPRNSTLNVATLLNELAHQFTYQARAKGIQLSVDTAPTIETVSDKDLLSLILQNLIGNAIKYTPKGRVQISAQPAVDGRGPRISIVDQGPGIAPEQMGTLFEPYKRGDTHGQAGVGLGLSIARQAADLLGVKLTAESTPGQGAAFHMDLKKD